MGGRTRQPRPDPGDSVRSANLKGQQTGRNEALFCQRLRMLSWTIGLSSFSKAQPTRLLSHQITSDCSASNPGSVSQQTVPGCKRLTAAPQKPLRDKSCITV